MRHLLRWTTIVGISLMVCFFASCALFDFQQKPVRYPVAFEAAIRTLANDLLDQVRRHAGNMSGQQKIVILIDPFIDPDKAEVPRVSKQIEEIIAKEAARNYINFEIAELTPEKIDQAEYVINGMIRFEPFKAGQTVYKKRFYHVSAAVGHIQKGKVVGNAEVWISNRDLDYTPIAVYKDSPLFYRELNEESQKTAETLQKEKDYYHSLKTKAILTQAGDYYGAGKYDQALKYFQMAADRKDGQLLKTYAGLYMVNYKLNRQSDAEKAFARLISLSIEKYGILTVKFLFEVNSTDFWKDQSLKKKYEVWLRRIGEYFKTHRYCLRIVGHCSRTGPETWNDQLSLLRALEIQKRLAATFPGIYTRSKAMGKGFSQNIIGSGTDDARDALDRRVELVIVDCKEL